MTAPPWWIPIVISGIALIPGLFAALDALRTRRQEKKQKDNIVFKNALELLEENRKESELLRTKLTNANKTIDDLTDKLRLANRTITKLNDDLADANTELHALRGQIESVSKQVDRDNDGRN
jgi:septal ring factor EnvC (AmiA/AmiB activator)